MLASQWKKGAAAGSPAKREPARAGQIRSFRIVKLDPAQFVFVPPKGADVVGN